MVVHAPFRFAPIHRWIYFPDWQDLVTHDVPFTDGLSGEIEIEIEAKTPLLVGGPRRRAKDNREGEVWPFVIRRRVRTSDGSETEKEEYAIPGSSLQGMVRSILEVAAFARLGPWIDDKRFGIRDLTPAAEPYYQRRLNQIQLGNPIKVDPNVKTGWLRRGDDGEFEMKRCSFARIEYDHLVHLTGVRKDLPNRGDFPAGNAGEVQFKAACQAAEVWRKKSYADERYTWVSPAKLEQDLLVEPRAPHIVPAHRGSSASHTAR
jgi:hypothetical protein